VKRDPIAGRKLLQLCGQVRDALTTILPGCGDRVLREALVYLVEPAPNAGRLRALATVPADGPEPGEVEAHLNRAAGMLRAEVASAIHRKRAPELIFAVT